MEVKDILSVLWRNNVDILFVYYLHKICILTNFGKYFSLFSLKYEKSYPLGAKVYSCVYPLYKISRHVWLIRHETCIINYAWKSYFHANSLFDIKWVWKISQKRFTILATWIVEFNDFWFEKNVFLIKSLFLSLIGRWVIEY